MGVVMTKILLVEDDKSLREIYGVRLLAEGYDIVSAGDGEEALAMAIKERPQLIVSDVMMPKISGFDMLDILRSTTETKDIKVIMMTALSSEDQRLRGEQLGADRYLVKSQVGIEDVVRTVHDVLADIPSAASTPQQTFSTPPPSAIPRPESNPAVPPRAPTAPAAAPQPQQPPVQTSPAPQPIANVQPQQPVQQPQPVAQPQPPIAQAQPQPVAQAPTTPPVAVAPVAAAAEPAANPVIQQPAPAPAPAPTGLPQPTAPFSTPRPANLGDRIIHPLEQQTPQPDVSNLMAQELSGIQQPAQAPVPPTQNPFQTPPSA